MATKSFQFTFQLPTGKMWKKAVLISGCDTGFGYSLACNLAEKHKDLITFACCFQEDSEGALSLKSKGGNLHVFQLEVTQEDSVQNLKAKIDAILLKENGQLWVLVNNAATLVFADAIWQTRYIVFFQQILLKSKQRGMDVFVLILVSMFQKRPKKPFSKIKTTY